MSLNLDKILLPLLKILPCYEVFFGNLIFAIIARMLCGNHLNNWTTSPSFPRADSQRGVAELTIARRKRVRAV